MEEVRAEASYRPYWIAWFVLLVLTMIMVFVGRPYVLVSGITIKASIIAFWFMHLRREKLGLVLCVLIAIFFTALVLYLLILPDGLRM